MTVSNESIAVIVVNYNSGALSARHIDFVAGDLPGARIVIVDNASTDGSEKLIEARMKEKNLGPALSYLPLSRNAGFSAGNNAAIAPLLASESPPEIFVLLNPDATPAPGALGKLSSFLAGSPRAGIAGAQLERPDGSVKGKSAHSFPEPLRDLTKFCSSFGPAQSLARRFGRAPSVPAGPPALTDWISGAACAVKRQVFEDAGLFDDGFFLYYEDVDLCRRAKLAGWEVWHLPECRVRHVGGASTGYSFETARRPRAWRVSRRRYFAKYHSPGVRALAEIAALPTYIAPERSSNGR